MFTQHWGKTGVRSGRGRSRERRTMQEEELERKDREKRERERERESVIAMTGIMLALSIRPRSFPHANAFTIVFFCHSATLVQSQLATLTLTHNPTHNPITNTRLNPDPWSWSLTDLHSARHLLNRSTRSQRGAYRNGTYWIATANWKA